MPFKVRCKVIGFMAGGEEPHCAFGYKVGDEIVYDGERFTGRICPQLFRSGMFAQIMAMFVAGDSFFQRLIFRYSIPPETSEKKDEAEERYFQIRAGAGISSPTEKGRGWTFVCPDPKALVFFQIEPCGLVEGGENAPFYKREMSILKKIKAQPGIGTAEILNKFSEHERNRIFPQLHPIMVDVMLEELADAGYIELRNGKAYPKQPPA